IRGMSLAPTGSTLGRATPDLPRSGPVVNLQVRDTDPRAGTDNGRDRILAACQEAHPQIVTLSSSNRDPYERHCSRCYRESGRCGEEAPMVGSPRRPGRLLHRMTGLLILTSAAVLLGRWSLRAQTSDLDKINHLILIYQENWSFDSLYGRFPGA